MSPADMHNKRRKFIKGLGAAGVIGLAGCLGGDDDDASAGDDDASADDDNASADDDNASADDDDDAPEQVDVVMAAPEGGGSWPPLLSLQRVAEEHSDSVSITATDSGGNEAALRLLDDGEVDIPQSDLPSYRAAENETDAFEDNPLSELPLFQMMNNTAEIHWMALDGTGIETTDDLAGAANWLMPTGWGTRAINLEVAAMAGMEEEITENQVLVDDGDAPGEISAGRIDAFTAYTNNRASLPGWLQEVDSREDIHYVEMTDTWREGIRQAQVTSLSTSPPDPYSQDVGTDELEIWVHGGAWMPGKHVSEEVVYELCRLGAEHTEELREGYADDLDRSDPAAYIGTGADIPFHPGSAEYLRDTDAWDDFDLEEGSLD